MRPDERVPAGIMDPTRRAQPGVWPEQCCVAAFVEASVRLLGREPLLPRTYAQRLGVTVGPTARNPWSLSVSADPDRWGVPTDLAKRRISSLFEAEHPGLAFRHVPFDTVAYRMFPELARQAALQGAVVGVGFDFGHLHGRGRVIRHVCRVEVGTSLDEVTLLDDSVGHQALRAKTSWADLTDAVYSVRDGFWMIGPLSSLVFDLA